MEVRIPGHHQNGIGNIIGESLTLNNDYINGQEMNRLFLLLSLLLFLGANMKSISAQSIPMRDYSIDIPGYTVFYSLPEIIVNEGITNEHWFRRKFDPLDASFIKNGYVNCASATYEFSGPLWIGNYGAITCDVNIIKRDAKYGESISSLESLKKYVLYWTEGWDFQYDIIKLCHVTTVKRYYGMDVNLRKEKPVMVGSPTESEIFSIPLEDFYFLDLGINIRESNSIKKKKWLARAREYREAIKRSIRIVSKEKPNSEKP